MSKAKKVVIVLANSLLVTKSSIENTLWPLEKILCIYHPLYFQKNPLEIRALIDLNSEVNTMTPAYTTRLDFNI